MTPHPTRAIPVILALLAAAPAPAAQTARLDTRDVVADAVRYVAEYRQAFRFLVADETYQQTRIRPGAPPSRRVMRGELFLTYLPADDEWIAVHDVADVDGEAVTDREDVRKLLTEGAELRGVVGRIADRNARFNIGGVTRNFNEPMLPLLLLDEKRIGGIRFDRARVEADGATTLVTLTFRERDRTTLVRGPAGPLRSRGEITVEAGTGRVRRTVFELEDGRVNARLTTSYGPDEKLALWVPVELREHYELVADDRITEVVSCTAHYTNYRRFTGSGRIK